MTLDQLLTRFDNVRRNGTGYTCDCPCHPSQSGKSLHISQKDEKIVMHDFGGCKTEDILQAKGLTFSDLNVNGNGNNVNLTKLAPKPHLGVKPLEWLADYCQVPIGFLGSLPIGEDGNNLVFGFEGTSTTKLRDAGGRAFRWEPKDSPTPILWPMPEATLPVTVWLCEGETDTIIARYSGLPAYAVTKGAGGTMTLGQAQALKQRGVKRVNILFDADKPGRAGAERVAEVLSEAGLEAFDIQIAQAGLVDPLRGQNDLRDGWLSTRDRQTMLDRLEKAAICVAATYTERPLQQSKTETFVSAKELSVGERESGIEWLDVLGCDGVIGRGLFTLMSARPKSGKTTMMAHTARKWLKQGRKVAWLTEEPRQKWKERIGKLAMDFDNLLLGFASRLTPEDWMEAVEALHPDVIVVDTARAFLQIQDENDAVCVHESLWPLIVTSRDLNTALVVLHHRRKVDGNEGTDHAGSHAYVGDCDIAITLREDTERRRQLQIRSRFDESPDKVLMELGIDGVYRALGRPEDVALAEVTSRVRLVLNIEWLSTADIVDALSEPKPSRENVRKALHALVEQNEVERQQGKGRNPDQWRLLCCSNDLSV